MPIYKYLVRVYGVIETPHTEYNSCNPARRLAESYATVIRRVTNVPSKEVSQQLIQASPLMSHIFQYSRTLIYHCNYF